MIRFSIRDVLWLMVVVAVSLSLLKAWQQDRIKLTDQRIGSEAQLMKIITTMKDKLDSSP